MNLSYNAAGQLTNETWSAGIISDISVISGYDSLLRRTSLAVLTNGSALSTTTYGYDAASRLAAVTNGSDSVEYVYLANSSLLTNTIFKHSGTTVMTTSRTYDNLNRLTEIRSQRSADSTVISSHAYQYNSANQRIRATLQDGSYWEYAYDSLGQVTNAVKKWSDNVLVAGQQFAYAYDSIGNRTSAKSGGDQNGLGLRSSTYTANSLNQYTERTVPGSFDVLGSAQSNATVTVNNLSTYENGGSNLYGFVNNDSIGNFDRLGLFIIANCYLEDYLRELGVPYQASTGKTFYQLPQSVTLTYSDLEKLIVGRMLQSSKGYILKRSGPNVILSLKEHVQARMTTVVNSATTQVTFRGGLQQYRDINDNAVSTSLLYSDPVAFFQAVNNRNTTVDCTLWAEILFRSGSGDGVFRTRPYGDVFIPGDWAYIKNRAHNSSWEPYYSGENVIHVGVNSSGEDRFFGLISQAYPVTVKTDREWFDDIRLRWANRNRTQYGDPRWGGGMYAGIKYPPNGLSP